MTTSARNTTALLAIPGIALVVAFFMPWFDLLGTTVSGYDVATADMLSAKKYLLWLAPLAGAVLAMTSLSGSKSSRDTGLAAAGVVLLPTIYYIGKGMLFGTSWGLWLVLIGAVALIILAAANKPQEMIVPALLIIAGFFLPWTTNHNADFASWGASGFELARQDDFMYTLLGLPSPKLAWLVPLTALAALVLSLAKGKTARIGGAAAGVAILGWLAYVSILSITSWGLWLTIAAGFVALLLSVRKA